MAGRSRRGGARVGSGRPTDPLLRVCACGGPKGREQRACSTCLFLQRAEKRRRACSYCGTVFTPPPSSQGRCCSAECSRKATRAGAEAGRSSQGLVVSPSLRREGIRRRSARRRDRLGARPQEGRWRKICERDHWLCWICGQMIEVDAGRWKDRGSVDHVIPVLSGGTEDESNLRAAHRGCNARRGPGRFQPAWQKVDGGQDQDRSGSPEN
jgi:hypothetical protein